MQCSTMQCIPLHCTTLHCLDAAGATQIAHNAMYNVYIALCTTQCNGAMVPLRIATIRRKWLFGLSRLTFLPWSFLHKTRKRYKTNAFCMILI